MANFKKAWVWLKTHWKLVLLVLGAVLGFLLRRKVGSGFSEAFKGLQEAHAAENKAIDAARLKEQEDVQKALRRRNATVDAVQLKFAKENEDLTKEKKKEVEALIKKHGDDPEELAKRLSKATGYTIILPEDD
jgi:hypothetical protein